MPHPNPIISFFPLKYYEDLFQNSSFYTVLSYDLLPYYFTLYLMFTIDKYYFCKKETAIHNDNETFCMLIHLN